jgi:hypothetical protein
MRYSGKTLMSFSLMVITGWMVITALKWPFRTGIFAIVVGIPVFLIAMVESYFSLFEKKAADRTPKEAESKLSESEDQVFTKRRTLQIFLWIISFFIMILFFGFQIAVPLFVFLYLKLDGKEKWRIVLPLTAAAWGFFYLLFILLLHALFPEGWIERALRVFLIG